MSPHRCRKLSYPQGEPIKEVGICTRVGSGHIREEVLRIFFMSDLVRMTGLSREGLKYYYREGLFKESARVGESGYKVFNDEAVNRLHYIIRLRKEGKSIRKIKEILKAQEEEHVP